MKQIIFSFLFLSGGVLFSQSALKTETISVNGNCGDCKKRIENAADIKGVKLTAWNQKTHVATVTYNPDKVSLSVIAKAIAKAGYDAGSEKAPDAAYKKLPDCCRYRDNKCTDPEK